MQKINDNTFLAEQQGIEVFHEGDVIREQEDGEIEERSIEDDVQVIRKIKETGKDEEIDEKIAIFLRERSLSEDLIRTLINTGLTDEHVRLLKTLNLSDDDIDSLRDLWQAKIEIDKSSDSVSSTSGSSSSNCHEKLSSNNIYLKRVLSKPLIQALCEIVAKKPADPVEYLGHWLLHYKICEERAMQLKGRKSDELSISMEELKLKKVDDKEDLFIEKKKDDEEEYGKDWNYINY